MTATGERSAYKKAPDHPPPERSRIPVPASEPHGTALDPNQQFPASAHMNSWFPIQITLSEENQKMKNSLALPLLYCCTGYMVRNEMHPKITQLDDTRADVVHKMRNLFLKSYAVEAGWLQAADFPPLRRSLTDFVRTDTEFFGIWKDREIIAAIEVKVQAHSLNIDSLVVDPDHFRQGLGKMLVSFVLDEFDKDRYTVETGAANLPAIKLYEKLGFVETERWDTDSGIVKVKMEKSGMPKDI